MTNMRNKRHTILKHGAETGNKMLNVLFDGITHEHVLYMIAVCTQLNKITFFNEMNDYFRNLGAVVGRNNFLRLKIKYCPT